MTILRENNLAKKYPALKKKISRMAYNAGKKSYTVECCGKNSFSRVLGKKSLPKPNHTYTHSKVKRTTPYIFWVTVAIKSRFVAFFVSCFAD